MSQVSRIQVVLEGSRVLGKGKYDPLKTTSSPYQNNGHQTSGIYSVSLNSLTGMYTNYVGLCKQQRWYHHYSLAYELVHPHHYELQLCEPAAAVFLQQGPCHLAHGWWWCTHSQ